MALRFLVELEGGVFDVAAACYTAHRAAAAAVGWSTLDQPSFWRLLRSKGREAVFLPGAKPGKLTDYFARFQAELDGDDRIADFRPHAGIGGVLQALRPFGDVIGVTPSPNVTAFVRLLEKAGLAGRLTRLERVEPDPRLRPAALRLLRAPPSTALVIASTDTLVRAARSAELLSVGISAGSCHPTRLHQAGADLVLTHLKELADDLKAGGPALIRAGLLPSVLGVLPR